MSSAASLRALVAVHRPQNKLFLNLCLVVAFVLHEGIIGSAAAPRVPVAVHRPHNKLSFNFVPCLAPVLHEGIVGSAAAPRVPVAVHRPQNKLLFDFVPCYGTCVTRGNYRLSGRTPCACRGTSAAEQAFLRVGALSWHLNCTREL